MKVRALLVAIVAILSVGWLSATIGPDANVQGTWTLTTTVFLANGASDSAGAEPQQGGAGCEYQGTAAVTQTGTNFTGTASLTLMNVPPPEAVACPAEMSAQMTGLVRGSAISGQLDGGVLFGMASFTGRIGGTPGNQVLKMKVDAQVPLPGAGGSTSVTQGPFVGGSATWSAAQIIDPIPTLGEWGLLLLTGLLMLAGLFFLKPNLA